MQIIPVIDLLNGIVVHAKKGDRKNYAPLQSKLTNSTEPQLVIDALRKIYPFNTFYIADLNSIQKREIDNAHFALIQQISVNNPTLNFWVDAGINSLPMWQQWSQLKIKTVIGSESFDNYQAYLNVITKNQNTAILSLDYKNNAFIGNAEIVANPSKWPSNIIVMTLARVGANTGPDLNKLKTIQRQCKQSNLFAAGGVRNTSDLNLLKKHQIHGALIATALHQQQITTSDLQLYYQ